MIPFSVYCSIFYEISFRSELCEKYNQVISYAKYRTIYYIVKEGKNNSYRMVGMLGQMTELFLREVSKAIRIYRCSYRISHSTRGLVVCTFNFIKYVPIVHTSRAHRHILVYLYR